jgi:hypothetical protein
MSKKYVFDWCKCNISVVNSMKDHPMLRDAFLGQNEFVVVFLKQRVSAEVWLEYKARIQSRFPGEYVIVCTIADNMLLDEFLSNDVYQVFNNLYEESALIKFGRRPLSEERNLYFLVFNFTSQSNVEDTLHIEIASEKDAYYLWAASDAEDSEFIGDDNGCYFYSMMKSPIASILKSINSVNEILFVAKYKGQIYGYANMQYNDKKKYKFSGPTFLFDTYAQLNVLEPIVNNTFHVAKLDTICSFSKWNRLDQSSGGFRGVGGKLWTTLCEYTSTEMYPFDYTVIHCLSLQEAVPFHLNNHMIANVSTPFLQYLSSVVNDSHLLEEGNTCKSCMYFILPGVRLGGDTQLLKGGKRGRRSRSRKRSTQRSRSGRRSRSRRRSRSGRRSRSTQRSRSGRRSRSRRRSTQRSRSGRRSRSRRRSTQRSRSGRRSRSTQRSRSGSRSSSKTTDVIYFSKSNKSDKKYMVQIGNKTVHFGAAGMSDYTHHKDPQRKQRYINRHNKRESWSKSGLKSAGFWSRWILWNKPSLQASIADTQRRFGIKIRKRS